MCDFCKSETLEDIYRPINSRRGMIVKVCEDCGLIHSKSTKKYESRPPGSMSADADRSSYRYTKDVVSERYNEYFNGNIDLEK